jgi:hypothetical protein
MACVHNCQISCIDVIRQTSQYYLATCSQDGLVHIFDVSKGLDKDFETFERITLSDHDGPVFTVVLYEDYMKKLRLVSCSSDTLLVYQINNSNDVTIIHKIKEDGLETYCLAYNSNLSQVVSGHNGKITQWKSTGFTFDTIFKTLKGNKNIDNFRIAIDATGSIMAVSCSDKFIRIRSTLDGSLLTKIPVAESISSLYFGINNSYLIASSVEGYIYFYQLDINLYISSVSRNDGKVDPMKQKLKLFEKMIQNDVNFSKMDKAQYLIDKIKNNEELGLEELRVLDSKYEIEHKFDIEKLELKDSEIISLKEDNQQNDEDEDNNANKLYVTKSKIFEKNLKEINANDLLKRSMLSQSRTSFTDTYFKKKIDIIAKSETVFKKANIEVKNIYLDNLENHSAMNNENEKIVSKAEAKEPSTIISQIEEVIPKVKTPTAIDNLIQKDQQLFEDISPKGKKRIEEPEKETQQMHIRVPDKIKEKIQSILNNKDIVEDINSNPNPNKTDDQEVNNESLTQNKEINTKVIEETKSIPYPSKSPSNHDLKKPVSKKTEDEFAINELTKLISNTNKYVDDIGNKYTSEINKKKETKEEEYDYYENDNIRLSLLNKIEEDKPQDHKFSNLVPLKSERAELFDITEDIKMEDANETTFNNITSTSRFDVSDTLVKKDKTFDINMFNQDKSLANNIFVDVSKDTFTISGFYKKNGYSDLIREHRCTISLPAVPPKKKTTKEIFVDFSSNLDKISKDELKEAKE